MDCESIGNNTVTYFLEYIISGKMGQLMEWRKLVRKQHPAPFYKHGLTLILTCISKHIPRKMWIEIADIFPNFNGQLTFPCMAHTGFKRASKGHKGKFSLYQSCMGSAWAVYMPLKILHGICMCVFPVWHLQQQALKDPVWDLYMGLPASATRRFFEEDDWLQLWTTTNMGYVFIRP